MNKSIRDVFKLLFILCGGVIVGYAASMIVSHFSIFTGLNSLNINFLIEQIIWLQVALVFILCLPAILMTQKAKQFLKETNQNLDIEDDFKGTKGSQILFQAMIFNRLYIILSFMAYGLATDPLNDYILGSTLIFIGFIFLNVINEVRIIRLVQMQDPMKKGDPTSMKFNKEYFSSLDEAEKNQVYQAGHHTFMFMDMVFIVLIPVAFIIKLIFDIGNTMLLTIGLIWLIQSIVYFYYSKRIV
ncbi:DUF3169 family protein [Amphibacillus sp. Q70]|uniref:DUF3169 family protein n=1 Tax=Amphibacillus sp. Q70 TaxID=3453416 RepID=UPI003F83D668